jgi:adenylate cyclase
MAAGGLPQSNRTHAVDCVLAALAMQRAAGALPWRLRAGVHTGPVMAGVIGRRKFAYDVWGDTVNTASRMESAGVAGQVNLSAAAYDRVREFFDCKPRGAIEAKGKGPVEMYEVSGIRAELSEDGAGVLPNEAFRERYAALRGAT